MVKSKQMVACEEWLTFVFCVGESCWRLTPERTREPPPCIDPCLADDPDVYASLDCPRTRPVYRPRTELTIPFPRWESASYHSVLIKLRLLAQLTWCGHCVVWERTLVTPISTGRVTDGGECGQRAEIESEPKQSNTRTMTTPVDVKALFEQWAQYSHQQQQQQQLRHEEELRLCRQTAETWRQEAIELFHRRDNVVAESPRSRINPARFLIKQTAEDDIETYLLAFERTAQREEWPEEQWVSLLAPFLSGIAQTAYQDTAADASTSYPMLKADILQRYGVSMITRAQRFHDWTYDVTVTPRAQVHDLLRLANSWLISEPVSLTPIERLVMDKFVRSLPYEARKTVCQQSPKTLDDVVTGMEGFLAVQAVIRGGRAPREEATRRPRERPTPRAPPGYPAATRESTLRTPRLYTEQRRCFDCGEEGHIARGCPHRADISMPSAGEATTGRPCGLMTACWAVDSGETTLTPVQANGRDGTALLDSGSSVTLVRPEFAGQPTQPDTVGVTCVHGETRQYPTTSLELGTVRGRCQGPAGVVEHLPVDILIGTDCPLFQALWDSLTDGRRRAPRGLDGSRPPSSRSRRTQLCGVQVADPQASTEPMSEAESDVADPGEEEAGAAATAAGVDTPPGDEEEERAWDDLFPQDLAEENPPVVAPLRGKFGGAQL